MNNRENVAIDLLKQVKLEMMNNGHVRYETLDKIDDLVNPKKYAIKAVPNPHKNSFPGNSVVDGYPDKYRYNTREEAIEGLLQLRNVWVNSPGEETIFYTIVKVEDS